jgi:hypothetical protein
MTKVERLERLLMNLKDETFEAQFLAEHSFTSATGQKIMLNDPRAIAELEARIAAEKAK